MFAKGFLAENDMLTFRGGTYNAVELLQQKYYYFHVKNKHQVDIDDKKLEDKLLC
jgi:hypothetical protein